VRPAEWPPPRHGNQPSLPAPGAVLHGGTPACEASNKTIVMCQVYEAFCAVVKTIATILRRRSANASVFHSFLLPNVIQFRSNRPKPARKMRANYRQTVFCAPPVFLRRINTCMSEYVQIPVVRGDRNARRWPQSARGAKSPKQHVMKVP